MPVRSLLPLPVWGRAVEVHVLPFECAISAWSNAPLPPALKKPAAQTSLGVVTDTASSSLKTDRFGLLWLLNSVSQGVATNDAAWRARWGWPGFRSRPGRCWALSPPVAAAAAGAGRVKIKLAARAAATYTAFTFMGPPAL